MLPIKNHLRTDGFSRPGDLESELRFFEDLFGKLDQELPNDPRLDKGQLFVLGCARSGTTVVYQAVCATQHFCYPTNFLSRFYFAPYLGARLQRMLYEFDFRGELSADLPANLFASDLGKTKGPLSPHEFWYFWRRFFSFGETQVLSDSQLRDVDTRRFRQEVVAIQSIWNQPITLKAMILNWHVPLLAKLFPKARFLFVERDEFSNARSLIGAREQFFGDPSHWYSFKPQGFEATRNLSPQHQTLWQVHQTNRATRAGLSEIAKERVAMLNYEDFCAAPSARLKTAMQHLGYSPEVLNFESMPESFPIKPPENLAKWNKIWVSLAEQFGGFDEEKIR